MEETPDGAPVELTTDVTGEFYTVARAFADDATAKINAGAALVYAIYHHPNGVKLMNSEFMSRGLTMAYIQACDAYGVGAGPDVAPVPVDRQTEAGE